MLKPAEASVSLLQTARLEELFAPIAGIASVGIAVSGGPDSLALLAMLARWAAKRPQRPTLTVFTVDHGLRPEAKDEADLVVRCARELGLEAIVLEWQGEKPVSGLQAAARAARYRLIGEVMDWRDISVLLTGHHMDDQAETILMRIAHGSGVTGSAGMSQWSEVEGVRVFRPLLAVRRRELEEVVAAMGWRAASDPSNADPSFERVRWRAAMPQLEALGLTIERLAQFGARLARADRALADFASRAYAALVRLDPLGTARLDRAALRDQPDAIRLRVLARIIDEAGGAARAPELSQVEALDAALNSGAALAGTTVGGCRILVEADDLVIAREAGRLRPETVTLRPGGRLVWDRRFEISSSADAPSLVVSPAGKMPRAELAALVGGGKLGPDAPLGAPQITADGKLVALGAVSFDSRLTVAFAFGPAKGAKH